MPGAEFPFQHFIEHAEINIDGSGIAAWVHFIGARTKQHIASVFLKHS